MYYIDELMLSGKPSRKSHEVLTWFDLCGIRQSQMMETTAPSIIARPWSCNLFSVFFYSIRMRNNIMLLLWLCWRVYEAHSSVQLEIIPGSNPADDIVYFRCIGDPDLLEDEIIPGSNPAQSISVHRKFRLTWRRNNSWFKSGAVYFRCIRIASFKTK